MSRLPLAGLRVLDFTWVIAGPYGTFHLAQLGAEVIKVEGIERFDQNRDHIPFAGRVPGLNRSGQFHYMNAGKQGVSLDITNAQDRETVLRLASVCDVVTENFSVGVLDRYGLGYPAIRKTRPDVVMISCSGFGQTGPMSGYSAYMNTIQGFTGMVDQNGTPGAAPNPLAVNWADYVAGTAMAFAIMAALHHRERTGKGQYIDLSMAENLMAMMGVPFMEYFASGRVPERMSNRSTSALQGVYKCSGDDRWLAIAVTNDGEWRALCKAMGNPAWAADPRFARMGSRLQAQDAIDAHIAKWTADKDAWDATRLLQAAGVPAGPTATAGDLAKDPHLRARGFLTSVETPDMGSRDYMGLPYVLSQPRGVRGPAPALGEHNRQVLGGLLGCPQAYVESRSQAAKQRMETFFQGKSH